MAMKRELPTVCGRQTSGRMPIALGRREEDKDRGGVEMHPERLFASLPCGGGYIRRT